MVRAETVLSVAAAGMILAFGSAAAAVDIETVPVGNTGNSNDSTGYGAVAYEYNIGTYEVSNAEYAELLNAVATVGDPYGLYNADMGGGWNDIGGISRTGSGTGGDPRVYSTRTNRGDRPVNYVGWGDAARFANWLHNGQPTGAQDLTTTEGGAYFLNGAMSNAAIQAVRREANWKWAIPSEDEWYKAAYHRNDGDTANYYDYPTRSDTAPTAEAPPGTDMVNGSANYEDGGYVDPTYYTTQRGAYDAKPSDSPYGTFDQGGNVWEWNEAIVSSYYRGIRGGSFVGIGNDNLRATFRPYGIFNAATAESHVVGFRVSENPAFTSVTLSAWVADVSGGWNVATAWSPPVVPDSNEFTAIFGSAITSARTVYVDTDVTVKNIQFDNANSYVIAGAGKVELESDTAVSTVTVTNGSHQFQAAVELVSNTNVNVADGTLLSFNSSLNLGGNTLTISGTGSGEVKINSALTTGSGTVIVTGGILGGVGTVGGDLVNSGGSVGPGNSAGILTVTGDFTQIAGGSLDVEVNGTAVGTEHDQLAVTGAANLAGTLNVLNGYVPKVRDAATIVTAAEVNGTFDTATGLNDLGGKVGLDWELTYAAGTATLTATAHQGDATLDSNVDVFDLAEVANHYDLPGTWGFEEADFTGDNKVDVFDLAVLANNYGYVGGGAPVPEPATVLTVTAAGLPMLLKRRRNP